MAHTNSNGTCNLGLVASTSSGNAVQLSINPVQIHPQNQSITGLTNKQALIQVCTSW